LKSKTSTLKADPHSRGWTPSAKPSSNRSTPPIPILPPSGRCGESQPTLVQFDNNSSERFTIISVFAYDRLGLLYAIAKVLFDQGLDLQVAKISTHLDQVVDVFYVTDFEGRKIEEPTRLYMLRQKLLAASEPA
jgi:UTP:GlnB (protein PII) uridylyltransferase